MTLLGGIWFTMIFYFMLDINNVEYGATEQRDEGRIKLALLDESTSNISVDVEELFYEECTQRGITLVSLHDFI